MEWEGDGIYSVALWNDQNRILTKVILMTSLNSSHAP